MRSWRVWSLAIAALGVALIVGAATISFPQVTARRVDAIALGDITANHCQDGGVLRVSFEWRGRRIQEIDDAPSCNHNRKAGDHFVAYVASNDPSDIGPNPDWILFPDQHDPFDFIGPNGQPDLMGMMGTCALLLAVAILAADWGLRRSAPFSGSWSV